MVTAYNLSVQSQPEGQRRRDDRGPRQPVLPGAAVLLVAAALAFTGRDTAAGKSWEAWIRKYWVKKSAGEGDLSLQPESLD